MKYRRIHIIGGGGSGKTWLATGLAALHSIECTELDHLFWDDASPAYNTRRAPEHRDEMLAQLVRKDKWILEGVYHQWVEPSFARADVIIILSTPVWIRHWRMIRRFVRRKLGLDTCHKRETIKSLWELIKWNHAYDGDNLKRTRECLKVHGHKVREFKSAAEALAAFS